jgi:hypothetical protein
MEENVKSFLDKIQELKDQKTKGYVRSINKDIDITTLSFKQQKNLISTIADGAIGVLKFQKIINDILIENSGNSNLLVTDKLPIILKLRIDAIGDIIEKDDTKIELTPILDKMKSLKIPKIPIIDGSVQVDIKIPTLAIESKIIQVAMDSIKQEASEFGSNIGNIYTYEIVKYVDKIRVGTDELDLSLIPIKERYKIVENLPLSVNKQIISFIQQLKNLDSDVLTYDSNKVLEIDVSFFDS